MEIDLSHSSGNVMGADTKSVSHLARDFEIGRPFGGWNISLSRMPTDRQKCTNDDAIVKLEEIGHGHLQGL